MTIEWHGSYVDRHLLVIIWKIAFAKSYFSLLQRVYVVAISHTCKLLSKLWLDEPIFNCGKGHIFVSIPKFGSKLCWLPYNDLHFLLCLCPEPCGLTRVHHCIVAIICFEDIIILPTLILAKLQLQVPVWWLWPTNSAMLNAKSTVFKVLIWLRYIHVSRGANSDIKEPAIVLLLDRSVLLVPLAHEILNLELFNNCVLGTALVLIN